MEQWNDAGNVIRQVMHRLEQTPRGKLERYRRIWRDTVGPLLAKKSVVGVVQGGKWIVYTENSAWMQELFMQKKRLLKSLNEQIDTDTVTDIEFKTGKVLPKAATTNKIKPEDESLPALSPAQEAEIARECESIPVPEIRTAILHLRQRQARLDQARRDAGWQPCLYCQVLTDCRNRVCDRCRTRLQEDSVRRLLQFLLRHPAAQYESVCQVLPVSEKEYEEARHYLIHRTLDRMWRRHDTPAEQWLLARLLTRLEGDALTEAHKTNLINKLVRQAAPDAEKNC